MVSRASHLIEHHQLVGIKPSDGSQYLLGQVSWLMYEPDGTLMAGRPAKVAPSVWSSMKTNRMCG